MRRFTSLLLSLLLTFTVFAYLRNSVLAVNDNKVTICHATESATNPYTRTVVSENAISGHFENNGTPKAGHELDLLFQGEVDCPGGIPTNAPTPTTFEIPTIIIPTFVTPTEEPGNESNGNIDLPCLLRLCPTATPTATPTVTPQPTVTPTSGPAPTNTPSSGGTGGPSSSGGSSSAPASQGQILGTNTMAATGAFTDTLMNLAAVSGLLSIAAAAKRYAQEKN